jgi:hypothetical protein
VGPRKQLNRPDAGRGAQPYLTARYWMPATQLLGALPVKLEDLGIGAGAAGSLELVEHLRGRVVQPIVVWDVAIGVTVKKPMSG